MTPVLLLRRKPYYTLAMLAAIAALVVACGGDDEGPTSGPPPGPGADTRAPEPVDDLSLDYDSTASAVVFSWTARRDDDVRDRADHYDIRYGRTFPLDWDAATRATNPPVPLAAGTPQQFTLADVIRGTDLYAAMRAIDAAGNESEIGLVSHVRIPGYSFDGYCYDTFSSAPVAGLDVTVTSRRIEQRVTGADGRFLIANFIPGPITVDLTRGAATTAYHSLTDVTTVSDDASVIYAMIPFQQPASPLYESVLELLKEGIMSPGSEKIIKRWSSYPVPWYAPTFVNVNGLDYHDLASRAAERWNTRLGFQMFELVSSNPAVGVLMEFVPHGSIGTANAITEYTSDPDNYPIHDRIRVVDNFADEARLYSIFMHELGHTIRLVHLQAGFIMFAGQPLPSDISDDEVLMVQLMLALPNGTNLSEYDGAPPIAR